MTEEGIDDSKTFEYVPHERYPPAASLPRALVFAFKADVMTPSENNSRALGLARVLAKPIKVPQLNTMLQRIREPASDRQFFRDGVAKAERRGRSIRACAA
jgi:hypothetical protein